MTVEELIILLESYPSYWTVTDSYGDEITDVESDDEEGIVKLL